MRKLLVYAILSLLTFILNFAIYNVSFNLQATPFLHEEHRLESGLMMLKTTLPAYFISSVIITVLFYLASKQKKKGEI